jgi:adenine-specific DNA methylase
MIQAKKLIEVAMPIKEISAESVRDKSIRHGHISTLHLWWQDDHCLFAVPWCLPV